MKKALLTIITMLSLASAFSQSVVYLTQEEFKTKVMDYTKEDPKYLGELPCVIDFYTTWCGPCKMFAPTVEKLAKEYAGKVIFYKVDIEKEQELGATFNIRSIPTIYFFPTQGNPRYVLGLQGEDQMNNYIKRLFFAK